VCASGASGRLCGSTSAPTVRTTSAPRTAKKCDDVDEDEEDPSPSSKDKEALGDPISPRRWRIGGLLGGTLCGRLIVGQQVQHAALVLMAALNAMRRAAWRSHCVRSSTTRYDLEELPLSKETY
jgi:hypothetical protein